MSMIMVIVFGTLMLSGGVAAILMKDTVSAILAAGAVSLVASLVYLLLGSPDVAMTEAAIGSALTTVVFLFSWARIQRQAKNKSEQPKPLANENEEKPS